MTTIAFVLLLLIGAYIVAVIEGWTLTGKFRPAAPLTGGAALLGRESLLPREPDRLLFEMAPPVLLVAAVSALAVLPLAPDLIVIDLATGALFVNAAWAYVMVAVVMAGWGPNGAYAMVGGWRFLGQLIAYSMLIVMPITAVAMRAESLSTVTVVESQAGLWNVVAQPLGFVLFWLAAMAASFVPPFDRPTADGELAAGVAAEYTGYRLAVFRLGRLVLVLSLAVAIVVFFLGGWAGPWAPPWVWSGGKTLVVVALMFGTGRFLPRLRSEQLFSWAWKLGIPLALANIAWVGIVLVVGA